MSDDAVPPEAEPSVFSSGKNKATSNATGALEPESATFTKPIRNYFRTVFRILFEPSKFFRAMPVDGGLSGPLAFALVTNWMGAALAYVWGSMTSQALISFLDKIPELANETSGSGQHFVQWLFGVGAVILDPFYTLFSIILTSFLVYLGAQLFIGTRLNPKTGKEEAITYESALRIVAYGLTPSIFFVIPFAGGLIVPIYKLIVTIIGVKEVYRTESIKAFFVTIFPKVLVLALAAFVIIVILTVFIGFFAFLFSA